MNKESIKNNIVQYLVGMLVLCTVLYFMMNKVIKNATVASNEKIERKIQDLQSSVNSINQKQDGILDAIDEIETYNAYISDAIIANTNKIDQYNKQLINMKNEYDEKIRSVDGYTSADLDSIFTGKYGKK